MLGGLTGFDRAQEAYDNLMPREPTAAEEAAAEALDEYGPLVEPLDCEACGNQAVCPSCWPERGTDR